MDSNQRKIILLQYSGEQVKDALGILMLSDAIKSGMVTLAAVADEYRTQEEIKKHKQVLERGEGNDPAFFERYLAGVTLKKDTPYTILINEVHYAMFNKYFFDYLRSEFDVKLVLIFRNMINNKMSPKVGAFSLEELQKTFDLIVTDEPYDSEYLGFPYLPDPLCLPEDVPECEPSDCFFAGADKGRIGAIYQVLRKCSDAGMTVDFCVIDESKHRLPGIKYTNWMTYRDITAANMATGCIVELLQAGQDGYSLRMQEAVLLGKKLLTNNPRVKESKYYQTGNIQFFRTVDEIDTEWMRSAPVRDYGYGGEYSGIAFVQKVMELL